MKQRGAGFEMPVFGLCIPQSAHNGKDASVEFWIDRVEECRQAAGMAEVTLADVAARAGVGYGTASRALGERRNVSSKARERVRRAAAELGYRPNAAAAVLGAKGRRRNSRLKAGWVSARRFEVEEFQAACEETGLEGEAVDPQEFGSVGEMVRVLWGRGFDGLFVNFERWPWSEEETAAADWSRFAVVKYKRIFPSLRFHVIRHSPFDFMRLALSKVRASRARRLGVLLMRTPSEEDNDARLGAVLVEREKWMAAGRELYWRMGEGHGGPSMVGAEDLGWLNGLRPDAIVGFTWRMGLELIEAGWRFPADAGFCAVIGPGAEVPMPEGIKISGCLPKHDEAFAMAMQVLREMLGRGERGFAAPAREHVIEPTWCEGNTFPALGEPT